MSLVNSTCFTFYGPRSAETRFCRTQNHSCGHVAGGTIRTVDRLRGRGSVRCCRRAGPAGAVRGAARAYSRGASSRGGRAAPEGAARAVVAVSGLWSGASRQVRRARGRSGTRKRSRRSAVLGNTNSLLDRTSVSKMYCVKALLDSLRSTTPTFPTFWVS